MTKALAKQEPVSTSVITEEQAALLTEGGFGGGLEDLTREDFAIPFLKLLQGLSPEVTRGDPKHIPGAEVGDFYNSLNGEVFKAEAGMEVVRVAFEKKYIEWRPRSAGGGLVKIHNSKEDAEENRIPAVGNEKTDTQIIETAQIYVLVRGEGGWTPAVLSWKMTYLKEARKWAGLVAEQTTQKWKLPVKQHGVLNMWTVVYRVASQMRKNDQGSFAVPVVAPLALAEPRVIRAAKEFRDTILTGKVKATFEEPDTSVESDDENANY